MDSMAQAFVSERVVTPDGVRRGAVLSEQGRIAGVCSADEIPPHYSIHNLGRSAVLPGLVDSHVHINEPGRTAWEGFWTATRAAAAGGYTTLVDMPLNCLPETTTAAALDAKRRAATGQCFVDWAAWGGVAGDNALDIQPLADAGVKGHKCFLVYPGCDGFQMVTLEQLEAALPHVARTGLPLLVHAELQQPIDDVAPSLVHQDWRRYDVYLRSRPDEAELAAIRTLLELCRAYRFHLHIVHLAAAQALLPLQQAREEGLPVTVETCPHYLYFAAEDIPDGSTLHKCAPPIRSRANREALWQGLRDGIIDLVATDHSPCPPAMKCLEDGRFDRAWGGIASLAVALPVMWTSMLARGMGLQDMARLLSQQPARLAQLGARKGAIAGGFDADLTIFDPEAAFTVSADTLPMKHALTPYEGVSLQGKVIATYLRGQEVYRDGTFAAAPFGIEV